MKSSSRVPTPADTKTDTRRAAFAGVRKKQFAARLLAWFKSVMRPFPWRETYRPYEVWLSEIMLQQTQAERGAERFLSWMRRFPTIASVAEASEEEILAAWEGLGYYSRARNLHAAAKQITARHGGEFPNAMEDIRALPGVGEYTAGAIASIAFNIPFPAVDANVLRIFARLLDIDRPPSDAGAKRLITDVVRVLLPERNPRDFCQALMELGALVCGRIPKCGVCPVAAFCEAHKRGVQGSRPAARPKAGRVSHEVAAGMVRWRGRFFITRRPPGGLWAGLWEFPSGPLLPGEEPGHAAARCAAEAIGVPVTAERELAVVRHGYTVNRVIMHGFICSAQSSPPPVPAGSGGLWAGVDDLAARPFPAGHRKLLECFGVKKHPLAGCSPIGDRAVVNAPHS